MWLPKEKGEGGGINWVFGINRYTLLHINNMNLLYNTENYIQYLVMTYNGKESEKESDSVMYNGTTLLPT